LTRPAFVESLLWKAGGFGEGVCLECASAARGKGGYVISSFNFVEEFLEFDKLRSKNRIFAQQLRFPTAAYSPFSAPVAKWRSLPIEPTPTCGSHLARTQTTCNSSDLVPVEAMNTVRVNGWKQLNALESTHRRPAPL
jgi:hypothetical protein